ncbi:MAG: hypothetical protein ACKVS9_10060 [Phycisphaerae bacterium]
MTKRVLGVFVLLTIVGQASASPPTASITGFVEWENGAMKFVDMRTLFPTGIALPPNASTGAIPFSFSTGTGSKRVVGVRLSIKNDADVSFDVVVVAPSEAESQTIGGNWIGTLREPTEGLHMDTEGGFWLVRRWPVIRSAGISVAGVSSFRPNGTSTTQSTSLPNDPTPDAEFRADATSTDSSLAVSVKFPSGETNRRVRVAAFGDWHEKEVLVRRNKASQGNWSNPLTRRGNFVLANYADGGNVSVQAPTSPNDAAAELSDWIRFVGTAAGLK